MGFEQPSRAISAVRYWRVENWRIALKIWAGFGVVLSFLALITIFAKLGFESADRHFFEYGELARETNVVRLVQHRRSAATSRC